VPPACFVGRQETDGGVSGTQRSTERPRIKALREVRCKGKEGQESQQTIGIWNGRGLRRGIGALHCITVYHGL